VDQRVSDRDRHHTLALEDPQPVAAPRLWRSAAQAAIIGGFIIAFVAALSLASAIVLPVTNAFVVTVLLSPLAVRLERIGMPPLIVAILLWVLVGAVFYGVLAMLASPLLDWVHKAPDIGRSIQDKLHVLDQPLAALKDLRNALLPNNKGGVGFDIATILSPLVSFVSPALGQILVFFGALFFMLAGRQRLRRSLVSFFGGRGARLRMLKIINDVERNLSGYLGTVAVINIFVGIGAGMIAWAVGLPDPPAWAVLGFVLNFIAYIGALIMEVAMFMAAVVTFPTLGQAILPPLLYAAMATIEGHFITPGVIGRRLTLNPLAVFLSLVFWAWLWGPVGAFIAVPVLIVGLVVVSHVFPKEEGSLPD